MKKKKLFAIAALMIIGAFSLCACKTEEPKAEVKKNTGVVETISEIPAASVETENDEEKTNEETNGCLFYDNYGLISTVENGEIASTVSVPKGYGSFIGFYKGAFIYSNYEYTDDGVGVFYINAMDIATGEIEEIFEGPNVYAVSIHDNVMRILFYEYETGKNWKGEYDLDTYSMISEGTNPFYAAMTGYTVCPSNVIQYRYMNQDPEYCVETYDFVLLRHDFDQYCLYDGKEIRDIAFEDNLNMVYAYDSDCFLYTCYNEGTYETSTLRLRLNEGNDYALSEVMTHFLGLYDGVVYWAERLDSDYGTPTYYVYRKDIKVGSDTELVYSMTTHPGMDSLVSAGISGFTVLGDDIFFVGDNTVETGWFKYSGKDKMVTDIQEVLKTYSYFDYCTMDVERRVVTCPECGKAVSSFYIEYPVLLDSLGENVAKINELIKDEAMAAADMADDAAEYELSQYPCDGHEWGYETNEIHFTNIRFLDENKRYLTFDEEGYWYGGGAHGQECLYHFLIDMQEGEIIDFLDLYKRTPEEFKITLASYVSADYSRREYEEGSTPYFAESVEELYDTVYEMVLPEMFKANFGMYGPGVSYNESTITFEFEPYNLGPYASGYICIDIPYGELGISLE